MKGQNVVDVFEPVKGAKIPPAQQYEMARQASAQMNLPDPNFGMKIRLTPNGFEHLLVNAHNRFAVDPSIYHSYSKRVPLGNAWIEVTATPRNIALTPGDGHSPVVCQGPGWLPKTDDEYLDSLYKRSLRGCSYQYKKITLESRGNPGNKLTAQLAINWDVTWVTDDGYTGQLPGMRTYAERSFGITELHNLVVG